MKRFLILSRLSFLALFVFSSTVSADYLEYKGSGNWVSSPSIVCSESGIQPVTFNRTSPDPVITGDVIDVGNCLTGSDSEYGEGFNAMNVRGLLRAGDDPNPPAPVCESPNYIDVVSGECVPPTELCFTTLEDMYPECVYIGEDDPDDDVPEGCVKNSAGMEMCLTDDPVCYEVDGKTVCPEPDNVCGIKNGVFSCVDPVVEGCGSFNGEQVCFTPQGDKVQPESPDHPKNGGNLDGDDTNDVTDSRPPDQGGDPSNQPDSGTTTDGGASEKQQKLGNKELSRNKQRHWRFIF